MRDLYGRVLVFKFVVKAPLMAVLKRVLLMLVQLVVLIVLSAGMWFALRWINSEFERVDFEMRRAQRLLGRLRTGALPQLQFDPATGHYHPVER